MKNDTTRRALLSVAMSCAREAQRANQLGQRRYAAGMHATALQYFAEAKALMPPAPVDIATESRREQGRAVAMAYAKVLTSGVH